MRCKLGKQLTRIISFHIPQKLLTTKCQWIEYDRGVLTPLSWQESYTPQLHYWQCSDLNAWDSWMPLKSVRTLPIWTVWVQSDLQLRQFLRLGADWSCFLLLKRVSSTSESQPSHALVPVAPTVPLVLENSALGFSFLRADLSVHCISSTSPGYHLWSMCLPLCIIGSCSLCSMSMCIPYIWSLALPAYQQMEKKKQENKMRRDQLNDEYLELLEKQRLYFKTVKEFKEVRTLLLCSTVMCSVTCALMYAQDFLIWCLSHHFHDVSWSFPPCELWIWFWEFFHC